MTNTKPYVIGIDMGGTNTVFGIVDARGIVLASNSIKTRKHARIEDYIDELYSETRRLISSIDAEDKIYECQLFHRNDRRRCQSSLAHSHTLRSDAQR